MTGSGLSLGRQRRRRRAIGLTALIDVIFLLVIFYLLVSQFSDLRSIPLAVGGAGPAPEFSQRWVIRLAADGGVSFNGEAIAMDELAARLAAARPSEATGVAIVVENGVALQRSVLILDAVAAAGFANLSLAREKAAR